MRRPIASDQLQEKVSERTGSEETPQPNLIYDLRAGDDSSGGFYADVAGFCDKLLAEIAVRAGAAIRNYGDFEQTTLNKPPRSFGEYSLDLLTLSLAFWRYGSSAECAPDWALDCAWKLLWLRRRSTLLKPLADLLRAAITRRFLIGGIRVGMNGPVSGDGKRASHTPKSVGSSKRGPESLDRLPRLVEWLEASGEFEQESIRLINWLRFLNTLPRTEALHVIETGAFLLAWFRREAEIVLGVYSRGVLSFLATEYRSRGCREDQILCGKEPVEYHLSMVAAEIMNRGLRPEFERKAHKVVLVPGCMRGGFAGSCKGRQTGADIECAGCNPQCAVNRISQRMSRLGARVFIVPHSTGFSRWLTRWQREPDTGVTAVACLLNILPGGYEMRSRRISSQCVPLDFPGCRKHWRLEDIATGLNEEQLVRIVTNHR